MNDILTLEKELAAVRESLNGDPVLRQLDIDPNYSVRQRAQAAIFDIGSSTSGITGAAQYNYDVAAKAFGLIFDSTRQIKVKVNAMNDKLIENRALRATGKLPD